MRPSVSPPALLPVLLAAVLAGCTGGQPAPDAFPTPAASRFAEGTCVLIAENVLAVGKAARDLGEGPQVEPGVTAALEQAQNGLSAVAEDAEPPVKPALDRVVTRIGLVRLAADARRYEPERASDLGEAYRELLAVCTAGSPAPSRG